MYQLRFYHDTEGAVLPLPEPDSRIHVRYKRIGQVQTQIVEGYLASVVNVTDEHKTIVEHDNNGWHGNFSILDIQRFPIL